MQIKIDGVVAALFGGIAMGAGLMFVLMDGQRVSESKLKDFTAAACVKYADREATAVASLSDFNMRANEAKLNNKERAIALNTCQLYAGAMTDALIQSSRR